MSSDADKRTTSNNFENDIQSLDAAATRTFHAKVGNDTSTDRYLNLNGGVSYGIEMIPTVACSITKINGKTLKSPMSIGTGGFRPQNGKFRSITVKAGSATIVEVFMKE